MATAQARIEALATAIGLKVKEYFLLNRYASVQTTAVGRTLALTDDNAAVEYTGASAANITVPPNSSVAFPIGTLIEITQMGAGQVTLVPGSGVTLNSAGALLKTRVQFSSVSIRKQATDAWLVVGDLA